MRKQNQDHWFERNRTLIIIVVSLIAVFLIGIKLNKSDYHGYYECWNKQLVKDLSLCPEKELGSYEEPIKEKVVENCLQIVQENARKNNHGWLVISGQVKNRCDYDNEYSKVYFEIYDENMKLLTTDFTFTNPSTIPVGETRSFEKTWTDDYVNEYIVNYKVFVQE